MTILITNDDGINAIGINVLAKIFCRDYDCIVVAPDGNRSACSHSLTIHQDIHYVKTQSEPYPVYAVSGSPADCVKLGILHFGHKPDYVISGINNGSNLGSDIMYSGTVSAATEAAHLGIPSLAVSLNKWDCKQEIYEKAAEFIHKNFSRIISLDIPLGTVLNVNYPAHMPCKGVKVTKAGINLYNDTFVEGECSGAVRLQGVPIEHDFNDEDCDVEWCKKGYITVTPLLIDRNDYATVTYLKKSGAFSK